jgi:FkbM family methyltransferase
MHSQKPLVSVGIPTYNRPRGLARTLACICAQTHENLEIIISDNASTDPAVLEMVLDAVGKDPRIVFFRQKENLGAFANFQFVYSKSSGEYFLWAADDDEWDPRFIETCLDEASEAATVMTGMEVHWRGSGRRELMGIPRLDPARPAVENLQTFLRMLTPGLIYGLHRTESMRHVLHARNFDFYDSYFVARQILGGGVRTLNPVLYSAGVDGFSYTIKYNNPEKAKLEYVPFLLSLMVLILGSRALTVRDKLLSLREAISSIKMQICHHERISRPFFFFMRQLLNQTCQWVRSIRNSYTRKTTTQPIPNDDEKSKESYAQCGEDLIVEFIFGALRISNFTYLDIGAHHPTRFSNTYRFYKKGMRGVCVEPDPDLFAVLAAKRPFDCHVNAGVSDVDQVAIPFYVLSTPTLNTFSREEAVRLTATGSLSLVRIVRIPVLSMQRLLTTHFPDQAPDFLSVDVEGLDYQILQAIDFSKWRPKVICVETISYSESRREIKEREARTLLECSGYFLYADTYVNSIFVDTAVWRNSA